MHSLHPFKCYFHSIPIGFNVVCGGGCSTITLCCATECYGCICVATISSGALGPFTPVDPWLVWRQISVKITPTASIMTKTASIMTKTASIMTKTASIITKTASIITKTASIMTKTASSL